MVVHSEFKLYFNLPLNLGMKLGKENRIKKKENSTLALGPKVFAGGPFPFFPCSRTDAAHGPTRSILFPWYSTYDMWAPLVTLFNQMRQTPSRARLRTHRSTLALSHATNMWAHLSRSLFLLRLPEQALWPGRQARTMTFDA